MGMGLSPVGTHNSVGWYGNFKSEKTIDIQIYGKKPNPLFNAKSDKYLSRLYGMLLSEKLIW